MRFKQITEAIPASLAKKIKQWPEVKQRYSGYNKVNLILNKVFEETTFETDSSKRRIYIPVISTIDSPPSAGYFNIGKYRDAIRDILVGGVWFSLDAITGQLTFDDPALSVEYPNIRVFFRKQMKKLPHGDQRFFEYKRLLDEFINSPARESLLYDRISHALSSYGFTIVNYKKGTCTKDKKNITTIASVLQRGGYANDNNDIIQAFANSPFRASSNTDSFEVVISRHWRDVATMSTGRHWDSSSCMNLNKGVNRKYVPSDVGCGTIVAYLINAGSSPAEKRANRALNNPMGRVLIKPMVNKSGNVAFIVENTLYGSVIPEFMQIVRKWCDSVNATLNPAGSYRLMRGLYKDSDATRGAKFFDEISLIKQNPERILSIDNPTDEQVTAAVTTWPSMFDKLINAGYRITTPMFIAVASHKKTSAYVNKYFTKWIEDAKPTVSDAEHLLRVDPGVVQEVVAAFNISEPAFLRAISKVGFKYACRVIEDAHNNGKFLFNGKTAAALFKRGRVEYMFTTVTTAVVGMLERMNAPMTQDIADVIARYEPQMFLNVLGDSEFMTPRAQKLVIKSAPMLIKKLFYWSNAAEGLLDYAVKCVKNDNIIDMVDFLQEKLLLTDERLVVMAVNNGAYLIQKLVSDNMAEKISDAVIYHAVNGKQVGNIVQVLRRAGIDLSDAGIIALFSNPTLLNDTDAMRTAVNGLIDSAQMYSYEVMKKVIDVFMAKPPHMTAKMDGLTRAIDFSELSDDEIMWFAKYDKLIPYMADTMIDREINFPPELRAAAIKKNAALVLKIPNATEEDLYKAVFWFGDSQYPPRSLTGPNIDARFGEGTAKRIIDRRNAELEERRKARDEYFANNK